MMAPLLAAALAAPPARAHHPCPDPCPALCADPDDAPCPAPPAPSTSPAEHPGLYTTDQRGTLVQTWAGPTTMRWFGRQLGTGGVVEGLVGARGETGGWAARGTVAVVETEEGVDIGRVDGGVRWEIPLGPLRFETGVSVGLLTYTGATNTLRGALNASGILGLAIDVPIGRFVHLLVGPRATWDLATASDPAPTSWSLMAGPALVFAPRSLRPPRPRARR